MAFTEPIVLETGFVSWNMKKTLCVTNVQRHFRTHFLLESKSTAGTRNSRVQAYYAKVKAQGDRQLLRILVEQVRQPTLRSPQKSTKKVIVESHIPRRTV